MTKLLILSDSHNSASAVERILHAESDATAVVFLGDGLRDLEEALTLHPKMKVYAVAGNCDLARWSRWTGWPPSIRWSFSILMVTCMA